MTNLATSLSSIICSCCDLGAHTLLCHNWTKVFMLITQNSKATNFQISLQRSYIFTSMHEILFTYLYSCTVGFQCALPMGHIQVPQNETVKMTTVNFQVTWVTYCNPFLFIIMCFTFEYFQLFSWIHISLRQLILNVVYSINIV